MSPAFVRADARELKERLCKHAANHRLRHKNTHCHHLANVRTKNVRDAVGNRGAQVVSHFGTAFNRTRLLLVMPGVCAQVGVGIKLQTIQ